MKITELKVEQKVMPELLAFAELLKANGFTVFFPYNEDGRKIEYMFFSKGKRIGYVQKRYFSFWSFSTINKPSHYQGTGYQIGNREENELTLELAERCINAPLVCPWVSRHGRSHPYHSTGRDSVKDYSGPEEYVSKGILNYWFY